MNNTSFLQASSLLVLSVLMGSSQAAVFSFQYTDTISSTTIAGLSAGDPVKITVNLDNGGATNNSQTWTAAHLQSIIFNAKCGTLLTTFTTPFGGGLLDSSSGNFTTDASGTLTAVMSGWTDSSVGSDFSTNGAAAPSSWYVNASNGIYYDAGGDISLTNVSNTANAASWGLPTAPTCPSAAVSAPLDLVGTHKPISFAKDVKVK